MPARRGRRHLLVVLGLVALLAALVPPDATLARRYLLAEALQFCLVALVFPLLAAAGLEGSTLASAPRHALGRALRSCTLGGACYLLLLVLWRLPFAVDGLGSHPGLVLVEVVSVAPVGLSFFLALLAPLAGQGSASPLTRIVSCVAVMWSIWILAYFSAMGRRPFFPAYAVIARRGLGVVADEQLAAGLLFLVGVLIFVPVIFANLMRVLGADEDPDIELRRLLRDERRREGLGSLGRREGPVRPGG